MIDESLKIQARDRYAAGEKVASICETVGISRPSLYLALRSGGAQFRGRPPTVSREIAAEVDALGSAVAVAAARGISKAAVYAALARVRRWDDPQESLIKD